MVQTVAMLASLKFGLHFWKWVHGKEHSGVLNALFSSNNTTSSPYRSLLRLNCFEKAKDRVIPRWNQTYTPTPFCTFRKTDWVQSIMDII